MLRLIDKPSGITEFFERTELTDFISSFNIRSKQPSLIFASNDPCVCLIFNFGFPVDVTSNKKSKTIASNQYNLMEKDHTNLGISSLSENAELFLHIVTLPQSYFREIVNFFALKSADLTDDAPFALKKSREISNEMHYNLRTLHQDHCTNEQEKVYVHGKLFTMLAILMQEEGRIVADCIDHCQALPRNKGSRFVTEYST